MAVELRIQLLLAALIPVIAELDMKFIKYPESVTAPVGDTVTFECEVNVPGEWLAWRWRPADAPDENWTILAKTSDKESHSSGTSTRHVVQVKENTQVAVFQCVVSYGSITLVSVPARLTIARVDTTNNSPERRVVTAPPHNTVVLHCKEPISDPPAILSWWKESPTGTQKQLDTPHGVLVINNATAEDSGTYGCRATNELSIQTVDLPEKTYLKIEQEGNGDVRFLETEEYAGKKDREGVLTVAVKLSGVLRLWCGAVSTPPPRVTWSREGRVPMKQRHENQLVITGFTIDDEGIYSCSANGIRRLWKVIALQPPRWEGTAQNLTVTEGQEAHIACGTLYGQPPPEVYWVLNGQRLKDGEGIRPINTDLYIDRAEKRQAGIVQCFACNQLGCAFDAALLAVVPLQIPDQDYSAEISKTMEFSSQSPKRHNKKNSRKHKPVMIPPSRPNVTRLTDESVMVSWSHANHGLPIQFFKVQYREVSNSSNIQWNTATQEILPYIHSYEIDGLTPDKYYKFKIAAVYSNQDNKQGKSSAKFHLQRGGFQKPQAPELIRAVATSPHTIQLEWNWSSGSEGVPAEGFYAYYRAVSSAGAYEKCTVAPRARSLSLPHLLPDTAYELKLQAYTHQAPSDFSTILVAKTLKALGAASTTSATPAAGGQEPRRAPDALVTAGGALGAAALLVILVVTLLLCRRAKRPSATKEKGSGPDAGGANGYIPAKVPITITSNPMHSEGGDGGVEMSFLHNNNTGNNDDTLPHSRKNGPARQYV